MTRHPFGEAREGASQSHGQLRFHGWLTAFFSRIKPAIDHLSSKAVGRSESPAAQPVFKSNPARRGQGDDDSAGRANQPEQRQLHAKRAREPSILSRLLLIVSLALCPTLAAHAVNDYFQYRERQQAVRDFALATAELRNSELERVVSSIDRLLGTAGRIPGVSSQDPLACKALKGLLIGSSDGVVLATADPAGHIRCATVVLDQPVELGDRDFVQTTIAEGRFTVGGYVRSRLDGEGALAFAEPVRDGGGQVVGVAIAYVNLDWLMSTMERARLLPGEDLVVADQNGVVLAHLPRSHNDWIGKSLPGKYLAIMEAPRAGVVDMDDLEGRPAIYAYIPVTVPPPNIYVLFSVQKDIAFAAIDAAAQRSLVLSAASVALGIFLAWRIAGKHVGRPVQRLLEVAQQCREGNYSARSVMIGGCAELRQLSREFNSMTNAIQLRDRQISAANRAKELTLATAGHDLRQPLQVVLSAIDLLSRKDLSDRERRYVQDAKRSIDRLTGGLDALVEMVRIHGDARESHQEPFPVDDLLKELASHWSGKAIEKELGFRTRPCGAVIISNKIMLGTVLHNLVGNAIKYTESGGILIACRTRNQGVWIDVYDTGPGIAQDRLEKVFGKFQQLDPAREGFGLGLWIARQTAEALGHEITVRCSLGKGCRFRVVAPLAPRASSA